ncbi:MAG: sodium:proton antiporter NhaD [Flavobacteriales bacterium]
MTTAILITFIIGYICIVAEHPLRVDKAATALVMGVLCWTFYTLGLADVHDAEQSLLHHIEEIAGILLFLMGAMTVVEVLDAHEGFRVITDRIHTTKKVRLMWLLGFFAFFLSAVLDNLTTTIVMVSLCRKLVDDQKTRWFYAGIIVIAANAGGAWSPIGDVTTTMLWIGGQLTTIPLIKELLLPSIINLVVPLAVLSFLLKGNVQRPASNSDQQTEVTRRERLVVFLVGIGGLLFVPVFKSITHLPPFMGMMLSLGIIWIITELLHGRKMHEERSRFSALSALRKIDMPSVLFFLGILLAVAALSEAGYLLQLSAVLKEQMGNVYAINISIGFLSAVIDNVPLVAASMGMYEIAPGITNDAWSNLFVSDGVFWHFLAYTAGTGGSMLIIGSAAGVAAMGIEKIPFMWYLKKISLWALVGYLAGAAIYIVLH